VAEWRGSERRKGKRKNRGTNRFSRDDLIFEAVGKSPKNRYALGSGNIVLA
jgi:hypothetical protein